MFNNINVLSLFICWESKYLMPWSTDNGWEDSPGSVITSESSFTHARAIVNNKSGNVLVTHLEESVCKTFLKVVPRQRVNLMNNNSLETPPYIISACELHLHSSI